MAGICMRGKITGRVDSEIKTSQNSGQLPLPHPQSTGANAGIELGCRASKTPMRKNRPWHMCPPKKPPPYAVNKQKQENEVE